jgi:hypothetical protein
MLAGKGNAAMLKNRAKHDPLVRHTRFQRKRFHDRQVAVKSALEASKPPPFAYYADRPVEFIEEVLKFILTEDQKKIVLSVLHNQETNVQAAHGLGKTAISARIAIFWIFAVGGLVISTAPTKRQVHELLWGEIRGAYDRYSTLLGGDRGQTFLRYSEAARGYGFTARDNNTDAFQGIHAHHLLVIEDEANGISPEIDDGAISCVTGTSNRILRIGNPTVPGTPFEESCEQSHIKLPVWTHPNVAWAYDRVETEIDGGVKVSHKLKPDVAAKILDKKGHVLPQDAWPDDLPRDLIPGAVSVQWIEKTRRTKGEGSTYWVGRVEAEFPQSAGNSIVPREWFLAARKRYDKNPEHWDEIAMAHPARYGLDVGDGGDPHALARWHGPVLYAVEEHPVFGDRQDVTRAATWQWKQFTAIPGTVGVDRLGVGAGALSALLDWLGDYTRSVELPSECHAVGCNFGGVSTTSKPADDKDEEIEDFVLADLKTDYYMAFREACRLGEIAIAPLGEEMEAKVMKGFSLIFYEEQPGGKTKIEAKSKTKKKLKRSTDPEDAIVIGFSTKPEESYPSYYA